MQQQVSVAICEAGGPKGRQGPGLPWLELMVMLIDRDRQGRWRRCSGKERDLAPDVALLPPPDSPAARTAMPQTARRRVSCLPSASQPARASASSHQRALDAPTGVAGECRTAVGLAYAGWLPTPILLPASRPSCDCNSTALLAGKYLATGTRSSLENAPNPPSHHLESHHSVDG